MQNGGYRQGAAKAPEKGSFPLDHFAECTTLFRTYMACLKQCDGDNRACKEPQKLYLVCRMEKGLMLTDELSRIGFDEQSMKQLDISTRYCCLKVECCDLFLFFLLASSGVATVAYHLRFLSITRF